MSITMRGNSVMGVGGEWEGWGGVGQDRCTVPGMSENMRMHSLKPEEYASDRMSCLSCCKIARPTKRGKEQFPSNMVSQRW